MRLWRLKDNTCTAVLQGHTATVFAVACTPDGKTLASGSTDKTVRLWCLKDNSCTAVLQGHAGPVHALACTPDGRTLASSGLDTTVRLWRLANNSCSAILEGHTGYVKALACTSDGQTLASGSGDKTVRLWRLKDNSCTAVFDGGQSAPIYALALAPDGATLVAGSRNSNIHLWRLKSSAAGGGQSNATFLPVRCLQQYFLISSVAHEPSLFFFCFDSGPLNFLHSWLAQHSVYHFTCSSNVCDNRGASPANSAGRILRGIHPWTAPFPRPEHVWCPCSGQAERAAAGATTHSLLHTD